MSEENSMDEVKCSKCGHKGEVMECAECKTMICLACFCKRRPECSCGSDRFIVSRSMIHHYHIYKEKAQLGKDDTNTLAILFRKISVAGQPAGDMAVLDGRRAYWQD